MKATHIETRSRRLARNTDLAPASKGSALPPASNASARPPISNAS